MDFTIELIPNDKYYADFYREWASQKWLRRWESRLGAFMILFWAGLRWFDSNRVLGIVPYIFIVIGFYEFIKPYYTKRKWVRERQKSQVNGQSISIHFADDLIKMDGPFSSSTVKWTGIKEIKQTTNAVFLIPESGISIYLPKSVFKSARDIDAVVNAKALSAAGARL